MIELVLAGNIGSVPARPESLREAERLAFEKVTGDSASVQSSPDLTFVIPQAAPRQDPTFEDEGSVFAGRNINYCVEKIYEFIDHPNSKIATHIAGFGCERIINTLRDLEAKARRYGANPEHSQFPTALFAAMELQQYVTKQTSSITGETEARVYLQSLEHDLDELRRWERDLDEAHGDPAA